MNAMPVRVLVVDDAVFMRSMIRGILEASGRYEVVAEAGSGSEAVEAFRTTRPDLVTLDIVMPEMGGIDACREILKEDPGCRIVMCSALGQESLVVECIAAGARDFLVKPFSPDAVLRVLDGAVDRETGIARA